MFEVPYYHGIIKKTVIAFGAMFAKLKVVRHDSEGNLLQTVNVPIVYGPKEKVFVKLRQDPNHKDYVYTVLPILAFQITGYNYDTARVKNPNNSIRCYKEGTVTMVGSPVPYNLDITLELLSKGAEDAMVVIEQILPMFTPSYTLTISVLDSMGIAQDIPLVLNGVSVSDDYEGDFSTRRLVTHTFNFTAKLDLYGGIKTGGVITRTETTIEDGLGQHISEGDLATGEITLDFWQSEDNE